LRQGIVCLTSAHQQTLLDILNNPWPQFVSYHTPNNDIPDNRIPASPDFPAPVGFNITNLDRFHHNPQACLSSTEDLSVFRLLLYGRKARYSEQALTSRWFLLATAFAVISSFSST